MFSQLYVWLYCMCIAVRSGMVYGGWDCALFLYALSRSAKWLKLLFSPRQCCWLNLLLSLFTECTHKRKMERVRERGVSVHWRTPWRSEHTSVIPRTRVQIWKHLLPSAYILSACVCLSVYTHTLTELIDLFLYLHRYRVFLSNGNGQFFCGSSWMRSER